jgi:hypothetical protein
LEGEFIFGYKILGGWFGIIGKFTKLNCQDFKTNFSHQNTDRNLKIQDPGDSEIFHD